MQYKTIVLGLIERRPKLHQRLWTSNRLQKTADRYTRELKERHEEWKAFITQQRPGSESLIATEAMELAIHEIEDSLPAESEEDQNEALSLEGAMAYIMRHTPPA